MFGEDLEDVFVVDGCDAAVWEVETEHVDYPRRVVLDQEGVGVGLPAHY